VKTEKIRVTKKFIFDMAHALYGYDGPCKNIHGHTYHLHVTILGVAISEANHPKNGMVIDFTDLKDLVKKEITDHFDHALVLNGDSPHKNIEVLHQQFDKIILVPFQPTCENLIVEIKDRLVPHLSGAQQLISLKLEETPTSFAEWHLSDNKI
jgi:6-pyruvoyltetrahydropterin/6-carboxytetrahydropterin synthase